MSESRHYGPLEQRRLSPIRNDPFVSDQKSADGSWSFKNALESYVSTARKNRWDIPDKPEKPIADMAAQKSRWDVQTKEGSKEITKPVNFGYDTPGGFFPRDISIISADFKAQRELELRNAPFSDEALDSLLPSKGYEILEVPVGYIPLMTPQRKYGSAPQKMLLEHINSPSAHVETLRVSDDLPSLKIEDLQCFGILLEKVQEDELPLEDLKRRKVLKLLLSIKNGAPPQRRRSMKFLVEKCKEFGAEILFDSILPILLTSSISDLERHYFVKLIDRLLFKLDFLVRPHVHKILIVIEPLLIDEDFLVRAEGREILSNLAKASGMPCMISAMRPDIEHNDEYIRNLTCRALAVVAHSLGISGMLPFLIAGTRSKKSWMARHSCLKVIQQISILSKTTILPYLQDFLTCIRNCIIDEDNFKVKTMAFLSLSAVSESSYPFGQDIFKEVLPKIWDVLSSSKGKLLIASLKSFGNISRLLDLDSVNFYASKLSRTIIN